MADPVTTPARIDKSAPSTEPLTLLLVAGEASGSQNIDFVLRNTETGEQTVYHSLFMGPPG